VIGTFADLEKFINKYSISGNIIKKEAYTITFSGEKFQEGNMALIGDAAGMTNPFSKGGLAVIIYASKILVDCLEKGSFHEYENKIKNHMAFSNIYGKVCKTINEMNQKDLEAIGEIVNNHEMLKMPAIAYFKALRYPYVIPKLITLYYGFKDGIIYAW